MEGRCVSCGKTADETHLAKCPICFRQFCDEHAYTRSGRPFCSRGCAEHFFFADPDD